MSVNTSQEQGQALSGPPATINGTLLPGEQASLSGAQSPGASHPVSEAELCCTVEQAEEIIGMEATGFTSGDQLEAFNCIPVDSAVAVECDEQVLGEFGRVLPKDLCTERKRIQFPRRPRRSSDRSEASWLMVGPGWSLLEMRIKLHWLPFVVIMTQNEY